MFGRSTRIKLEKQMHSAGGLVVAFAENAFSRQHVDDEKAKGARIRRGIAHARVNGVNIRVDMDDEEEAGRASRRRRSPVPAPVFVTSSKCPSLPLGEGLPHAAPPGESRES